MISICIQSFIKSALLNFQDGREAIS